MKKKVAIIIPTHKSKLNDVELNSFLNTLKIFINRDIIITLPYDVEYGFFTKYESLKQIKIINLKKGYLGSIPNYNKMALSTEYYDIFSEYDYILICHLDAWVFKDDLDYWINLGYDYYGAPLFLPDNKKVNNLEKIMVPYGGNGGLSLRKVSSMIKYLDKDEPREINILLIIKYFIFLFLNKKRLFLKIYLKNLFIEIFRKNHFKNLNNLNEDIIISLIYPIIHKKLKIAPSKICKFFSLEVFMKEMIFINLKNTLPMGVHGYDKYITEKDFKLLLMISENTKKNIDKNLDNKTKIVTIVTVIKDICINKREILLQECLESVKKQSYENIEHLIIDGNSNDGTINLLDKLKSDYKFRYISKSDNNVWEGMQNGLIEATGDYINFLNSDDTFSSIHSVEIAIKTLIEENLDWFFSDANIITLDNKIVKFPTSIIGVFGCMGIVHQTIFLKTNLLKKLGSFQTEYITRENFMMMQLYINNYRFAYCKQILVNYKEGGLSYYEYSGKNLEKTKMDFSNYFYELAGKRWGLSLKNCYHFFGWEFVYNEKFLNILKILFKVKDNKIRFYIIDKYYLFKYASTYTKIKNLINRYLR